MVWPLRLYQHITQFITLVASVWQQQRTFFLEHNEGKCPQKLFISNLIEELKQWKAEGDQILIGIDANEHLNSQTDLEKVLAKEVIFNAITYHYPDQPTLLTRNPGKSTLDSIFCRHSFLCKKICYTFTALLMR